MSFIERLELTPEEKQIYQLLLGCGQLTSFETAQFSNLHLSKVNVALDALVSKGAIGVSEGYINKYYVKIPLEYLATTSEKLSSDIKTNLNETTNFIQSKKESFNLLRENLTRQLEESAEQKKAAIDSSLAATHSSLNASNQQQKRAVSEKSASLIAKYNVLEKEKKAELNAAIKGYLDENVSNLNQAKTTMNTVVGNIKQQTEESVSVSNNQISQLSQDSINTVQSVSDSLQPKLNELHQKYFSEVNELMQLIDQRIDISKLDVRAFNRAQSEIYLGYSSEITRNAEKNIDSVSETVSTNLQGLGESLDLILNRKVEELSLNVQEAVNSLNEKIENIKATLVSELQQQKSTTISATVSQIKESMALKYNDLQNNEQNQRNNLVSERDMFMQKLESHYNETIQNYNERLSEVKVGATERFTSFNEEFSGKFNEISHNVVANLNSNIQSFRTLSEQLNTVFSDSFVAGSNQLKEKWSDLISNAETLIQESETTITQHFQEVSNLVQATTSSFNEDLNSFLQQSLDSAVSSVGKIANSSKANIDEGKQLLTGSLNSEIDDSTKFIDDNNRKMSDTANYLLSMTMKLKNDFRTLEATSKETTIPPVQTTSIIGLEAVKENIARIVKDTKRGVTILSPIKDYIPLDAIKLLPTTAKVTLVTKLDEDTDGDWISSALESEANVEIRKFRDTGTGVELPRFIGVERENEEVIIAAQDETTGEVVGILSKSTYFAKLVSYIVIADFARGRSSQIK
ncbi:MAG: hypothetical protein ACTSVO_08685 [Candidatus Heimdallarchaeaceae archaeon]